LAVLHLTLPAIGAYVVSADDLGSLTEVPATWLGKSLSASLGHNNLLELVAERHRTTPRTVERMNPGVAWDDVEPGTVLFVPDVGQVRLGRPVTRLVIRLGAHELEAFDSDGRLVAHFPVSIGRSVEQRPLGELRVTTTARDPNYTFDPDVFPESAEGRELGRRLVIPPGPNNPVGLAWIGLDCPGYGIHGTPEPEHIGITESHGCFRLANWDALVLLEAAWVGLPVVVEP
jgi:lipoprotein-anchoring transpeptidase ErfK/SrfK